MRRNCLLIWMALVLTSLMVLGCGSDKVTQPEESLDEKIEGLPEADPKLQAQIAVLVNQLDDETTEVRRTAALSLAKLNHPAAVPGLIKASYDDDEEIRGIARDAIVKIGEPAVPSLIREVNRVGAEGSSKQERLANVVAKMGKLVVTPLMEIWENQKDNSDALREYAAELLVEIGAPSVPPLVAKLNQGDENIRLETMRLLAEIGQEAKEAVPVLIPMLDDPNDNIALWAAIALRQIGTPEAIAAAQAFQQKAEAEWRKDRPPARLISIFPQDGAFVADNATLFLAFDNPPDSVSINGTPATVEGSKAEWRLRGVGGGLTRFQIEWKNINGTDGEGAVVTLNVAGVDNAPPAIIGGSVKDGDKDVDPDPLNANGITIEFNKQVRGRAEIQTEGGGGLGWLDDWRDDSVTLLPQGGKKLEFETTYVIILSRVRDAAGNEMPLTRITFTTPPL